MHANWALSVQQEFSSCLCPQCSDSGSPVVHTHFSSLGPGLLGIPLWMMPRYGFPWLGKVLDKGQWLD
jgi:hypothetical protein